MKQKSKPKYETLENLVNYIEEPNRSICLQFMNENAELLSTAYGSKSNHQAWKGGYIDHIQEVMNFGIVLYNEIDNLRKNTFSLSDAMLVLFLHDIEKPWKYNFENGQAEMKPEMTSRKYVKEFAADIISKYGFVLNDDIKNGLEYVEGERDNYSPGKRGSPSHRSILPHVRPLECKRMV
ncbi:MAG: hypothetical protein ACP5N3_01585 [Candidatus Nanoarchaeia archaeon]